MRSNKHNTNRHKNRFSEERAPKISIFIDNRNAVKEALHQQQEQRQQQQQEQHQEIEEKKGGLLGLLKRFCCG